jgi:hypothetical protein
MKSILASKSLLLAISALLLVSTRAGGAERATDAIEVVRTAYQTDRQAFLAGTLQLTETEGAAFWPLYESYRADIEKIGDGLVKLVLEYGDVYPNVPEERARQMLKDYSALEGKLASKRAWYFKRAGKIISASKALRWAQLENRMDLVLRLQLAGSVPLMPAAPAKP